MIPNSKNDETIHQLFIQIGSYLYDYEKAININEKISELFEALATIPLDKSAEDKRVKILNNLKSDFQQLKRNSLKQLNSKTQYEHLYNNTLEVYLWILDVESDKVSTCL